MTSRTLPTIPNKPTSSTSSTNSNSITNSTTNSSYNPLLIAGVALGATALTGLAIYALTRPPPANKNKRSTGGSKLKGRGSSSKNKSASSANRKGSGGNGVGSNDDAEDEEDEEENEGSNVAPSSSVALTKETVVRIFQEMTTRLQHVIVRLAQEEQRIMSSGSLQGISHEQLQRYLIQRFQEAVAEVEAEVYREFKVTEDQVKAATDVFSEEAELKTAVAQLKTVYNAVMNPVEPSVEVPEHLTLDKTLLLLKETMDILREKAIEVTDKLKKKGIDRVKDPNKFQQEFTNLYAVEVDSARRQLYLDNNIDKDEYVQGAVIKYQASEKFQTELKNYSEIHNKKMADIGFFPSTSGLQ